MRPNSGDRMVAKAKVGLIKGIHSENAECFLGIPFAKPPVGELRFMPPQPVTSLGEFDASNFGPECTQSPTPLQQMLGGDPRPQSEDCLTLNVFAPGGPGIHPVMVWIHGGGFTSGSGSIPWYHAQRVAERGVVVVTINYRLGPLGFLDLSAVLGERYATSGNAGIADQIAALAWVRDNIEAFGGNPDQVTIFGESAGAMSVATLMATPLARGLFNRAIAQSGAAHNVLSQAQSHAVADRVLHQLEIDRHEAHKLTDLPVSELVSASDAVWRELLVGIESEHETTLALPFQPVVDHLVLPATPIELIGQGSAAQIDLITGTTKDEWNLFSIADPSFEAASPETVRSWANKLFARRSPEHPERGAAVVERYRKLLGPDQAPADHQRAWNAFCTDRVFRIPMLRLAEAHVANANPGTNTFVYRFDISSKGPFGDKLGACHAIDVPFTFNRIDAPGTSLFVGDVTEINSSIASAMVDAWTSFAKKGHPTAPLFGEWETYDHFKRATLVIDESPHLQNDPGELERLMWLDII